MQGTLPILRFLGRSFPETHIYGADPVQASQVWFLTRLKPQIDSWLDFVQDSLSTADFKILSSAFETLNTHLALRSFIVGYSLSLADIAVWGALNGNGIFKKSLKSGNQGHLSRWFQHLGSLPVFQAACSEFESAKTNANKVIFLK